MSEPLTVENILYKPPLVLIIIFFSTSFVITLTSCIVVKSKNFPRFSLTVTGILFELLLAVSAFIAYVNFTIEFRRKMKQSFYSYGTKVSNRTNLMDTLQNDFECCGIDAYTEWLQVYSFVPESCNASMHGGLGKLRGCYSVIKKLSAFYWTRVIICLLMFIVVKIAVLGMYECSGAPEAEEKDPEDTDELSLAI